MFDLLFLGTGASVPAKDRALPCVAARSGSGIVLFDCGEGSQRQLMCSRFSFMKISAIFITHLHGDHFFGLPGLLQTLGMSGRREPLTVCGPQGFSKALRSSLGACEGEIEYPLEMRDVAPGDIIEVNDLTVSVFRTEHGILSQGYIVREPDVRGKIDTAKAKGLGIKGKDFRTLEEGGSVGGVTLQDISLPPTKGCSVAYTGDTVRMPEIAEAVKGVDILIHEATFLKANAENARLHYHSTAAEAAETAKEAGVGHLFLVHISNRYKDRSEVLAEAAEIFPETTVPEDFDFFRMTKNGIRSV